MVKTNYKDRKEFLERAIVKIVGSAAIIITERGSRAIAPISQLCEIAKRLCLDLENYDCEKMQVKSKYESEDKEIK